MDTATLIDVFRCAEALLEHGDTLADAGQNKRAASAYSRAAGMVLDALDDVMAERRSAA